MSYMSSGRKCYSGSGERRRGRRESSSRSRGARRGGYGYGASHGTNSHSGGHASGARTKGGNHVPGGSSKCGSNSAGCSASYGNGRRSRSPAPRHGETSKRGEPDNDDSGEDSRDEADRDEKAHHSQSGNGKTSSSHKSESSHATLARSGGKAPPGVPLLVSGCGNETISEIIAGTYLPFSMNHSKVVYRKEEKSRGLDVLIYYWDDRDGAELCGWWFGPNIGGDQVWAYHPSRTAATPPASEWNIPHDGQIDPDFSVTAHKGAISSGAKRPADKTSAMESSVQDSPASRSEGHPPRKQPRVNASGGVSVAAAAAAAAASAAAPTSTSRGSARVPDGTGTHGSDRGAGSSGPARDTRGSGHRGQDDDSAEEETPATTRRGGSGRNGGRDAVEPAEKTSPLELPRAGGSSASTHAYFVNAYNRRREERAKAEEARKREEESRRRDGDQHCRDEEAKRLELEQQMEQMRREEEEERRQMEELRWRADERRKKEEEFQRKMQDIQKAPPIIEHAPDSRKEHPSAHTSPGGRGDAGGELRSRRGDGQRTSGRGSRANAPVHEDEEAKPLASLSERASANDRRTSREKVGGTELRAHDQRGADQRARAEQRGADQRGADQRGADQRGADQRGADQRGADQRGDRRHTDKRDGAHRVNDRGNDRADRGDHCCVSSRGDGDDRRNPRDDADVPSRKRDDERRRRDDEGRKRDDLRRSDVETRRGEPDQRRRGDDARGGPQDRRRDDERRRREDDEGRRRNNDERRREDDRRRREDDENRCRKEEEQRREDEERRRRDEERRREEEDMQRRRDEERRKRDEEKQRKEEERQKHEEELQRKRDEKRRREEAERAKADDRRRAEREILRKEEEERRKRDDERKKEEWKRQEEYMKKRAEDDKQRAEEDKKKKEEESHLLRQQQATLSVLRVLQKLSNANPDNFDALKGELEQVLVTELPETGVQQEILKAEADRVLEYAKQYVEQIREQQRKWEELRIQQQHKIEEQERTSRRLLEELEQLVTVAEAASESAHYTAAPLAGDHELENVQVLQISKAVTQAGTTAMSACSACADFIMQKRAIIEEAENIRAESVNFIALIQPRIQGATRQASEALQRAKTNKDKIARKMAANRWSEKKSDIFKKYDKDGDGALNREEVAAFAKGEYSFDAPDENLDRMIRQLVQVGSKGLVFEQFQLLKTAIGIAREEVRGKHKRAEREERERREHEEAQARQAVIRQKKVALAQTGEGLNELLNQLEPKVQCAEREAEALASEAGQLQIESLKEKANLVEAAVKSTHAELVEIHQRIQSLCQQASEVQELVDSLRPELTALTGRVEICDLRLQKALGMAMHGRQLAIHKAFAEYEGLRMDVAAQLRACIEAQGGKVDDLWGAICLAGNGTVTLDNIKHFLGQHNCEINVQKLERLLGAHQDPNRLFSSQADVNKVGSTAADDPAGVLTNGLPEHNQNTRQVAGTVEASAAEHEQQVDASESGDTIKADQPENDPLAGRDAPDQAQTKALACHGEGEKGGAKDDVARDQDDADGSTLSQSSSAKLQLTKDDFTRLVRIYYKVVREIVLSDHHLIEQSGQIRRMEIGEVVEVYQGPVIDTSVGVYRIHGRALRDGIVGWVTVTGNEGITFLMPGGNVFKVMRSTALSEDLKDLEGARTLRMLKEGEVLEVLEWARTSRSALGVTRVKARVQGDGAIGWATTIDNDGSVYLEAT